MAAKKPKKSQRSVKAFVKAERGAVKDMRRNPIEDPKNVPLVKTLVEGYLRRIGRLDVLETYKIAEAGYDQGAEIGNRTRDRVIVLLKPKGESKADWALLGFKRTKEDDYAGLGLERWFADPYSTHGARMEHASRIYSAPSPWPIAPVTFGNDEFYGRPMPVFNVKHQGKALTPKELEELLFAMAAQLGRGHALSVDGGEPEKLAEAFEAEFAKLQEIAGAVVAEALPAHRRYLSRLKRESLR